MEEGQWGETSCFQFRVIYASCQFQGMLSMSQGALWRIPPHESCDLGKVPLRFRERLLIVTGLSYLPGLLQQCIHLWLAMRLLDRQDRQAVERHADQPEQTLLPRIG